MKIPALAGVAQWIECWPAKGSLFDSQSGHIPGLWARCPARRAKAPQIDVSLSFSLPSPLSKNKIFKKLHKVNV